MPTNKVFVFDVDGTLTPSRTVINPTFAEYFIDAEYCVMAREKRIVFFSSVFQVVFQTVFQVVFQMVFR